MLTLPQKSFATVYTSNGRHFTFKVDGSALQLQSSTVYIQQNNRRFRSIHSAHRFCSAYGNVMGAYIQEQGSGYYGYGPTIAILTSGEFMRSKITPPPAINPNSKPTLQRTNTLELPTTQLKRYNAAVPCSL